MRKKGEEKEGSKALSHIHTCRLVFYTTPLPCLYRNHSMSDQPRAWNQAPTDTGFVCNLTNPPSIFNFHIFHSMTSTLIIIYSCYENMQKGPGCKVVSKMNCN